MKKQNYLTKNYLFQKVISQKNKKVNQSYFVYVAFNHLPRHRFGISVGKKLLNAVGRNHVKRQIRSMLRQLNYLSNSNIKQVVKGLDIVIMIRPLYLEYNFDSNFKQLSNLLKNINFSRKSKRRVPYKTRPHAT